MSSRKMVNNITELIGDTPAVRINRLTGENDGEVYVKLEAFNPSGSVKDRAAYHMIAEAERLGIVGKSGNWYTYEGEKFAQGIQKAADALREDDELRESVAEAARKELQK